MTALTPERLRELREEVAYNPMGYARHDVLEALLDERDALAAKLAAVEAERDEARAEVERLRALVPNRATIEQGIADWIRRTAPAVAGFSLSDLATDIMLAVEMGRRLRPGDALGVGPVVRLEFKGAELRRLISEAAERIVRELVEDAWAAAPSDFVGWQELLGAAGKAGEWLIGDDGQLIAYALDAPGEDRTVNAVLRIPGPPRRNAGGAR